MPKDDNERRLTFKQKLFAKKYIEKKGNGTQAALEVYDTTDYDTAAQIGSSNLRKPHVKNAIDQAMQAQGINEDWIIAKVKENILAGTGKKATASDSLRGIELLSKLSGKYDKDKDTSNKHIHFHGMSKQELLEEREKIRGMTDAIIDKDS